MEQQELTTVPWDIIVCPHCHQPLERANEDIICTSCNVSYSRTIKGQIDLRLRKNKKIMVPFNLKPSFLPSASDSVFHILPLNPNPCGNFGEAAGTIKALSSYIPKAKTNHSLMLDLGCGNTGHKATFIHAGFKYIGIDYNATEATLLGDAHALPFKEDCFEFIFSRAVLEHLQFPFLAIDEVYRTLKPNSKFIGTAAFLEPFHGNSFYHQTHLGLLNCLEHAGFNVEHISPNPEWDLLRAQAEMSLFPKMPLTISRSLVAPLRSLHKTWWKIGRRFNPEADELKRLLLTAGSFTFIAIKNN